MSFESGWTWLFKDTKKYWHFFWCIESQLKWNCLPYSLSTPDRSIFNPGLACLFNRPLWWRTGSSRIKSMSLATWDADSKGTDLPYVDRHRCVLRDSEIPLSCWFSCTEARARAALMRVLGIEISTKDVIGFRLRFWCRSATHSSSVMELSSSSCSSSMFGWPQCEEEKSIWNWDERLNLPVDSLQIDTTTCTSLA